MQLAPSARVSCLYSPNCLEKLSEKSRTPLQRSLTGHRNDTFRAVLAFVYWPNLRSKPRSDPFLDSFRREILGNPRGEIVFTSLATTRTTKERLVQQA